MRHLWFALLLFTAVFWVVANAQSLKSDQWAKAAKVAMWGFVALFVTGILLTTIVTLF
jgi:uncharacterized membrane protein YwzB